jgi:hypothetical protein
MKEKRGEIMGRHSQTKAQKKKSILINLVFLLASFIVIFGFTIAIWIRGQQEESIIENRPLAKFPKFSLNDFFQGKYQDDLEKSLSDQMLWSQSIKTAMTSRKSEVIGEWQKRLVANIEEEEPLTEEETQNQTTDGKVEEKPKEIRKIKYMPISGGNVYHYGDSQYMVFKCRSLKNAKSKIDEMAQSYQKHFKDIDSYFYFVNISKSIDFNKVDETENEFLTYIKQAFSDFQCDGLKIDSYEQYMDYFYETDHHWNYKGSYQGYKDIINLMLPEENVLEPTETKTFDTYYYGSNARTTAVYTNKEKFTVYDFKIPKYTTYVNGSVSGYGNRDMYYNNGYSTEKGYNHYGAFYGGDFAEVSFDFKQPEKENLLVIAPSYSNAINKLVASHFNKTYYIDLRHYQNTYGKAFNPEEFCRKNKIGKFLFLISIDHLTNGNFELAN